jgi:hypothetical protein
MYAATECVNAETRILKSMKPLTKGLDVVQSSLKGGKVTN